MACEMCPFVEMETGGAAQLAPDVVVRAMRHKHIVYMPKSIVADMSFLLRDDFPDPSSVDHVFPAG